ncbi:MAG: hypothetical protein IAX21_05755 [Candidatus Bathyarchaeota archaeon]|nr:hypothetical protein [Candidatus Bathyarchaeum tardum]WGM89542.1 MAG: hypothetical protein NUK63_11690 [Candidatus Bathyarchaeum tardum]WNZ30345.1 MAG: hypothetical protein IAX21_05755 [Candidatus Bathyarchaeota archaeon]
MPHVVLTGNISLRDIFEKIEAFVVRENKSILKISDKFINQDETSILVESLTIEDKNKTSFLVLLSKREDGLVVRIYPQIDVEKTDGVKKILAKIADNLIAAFPSLEVGKTNLQEFLQNKP